MRLSSLLFLYLLSTLSLFLHCSSLVVTAVGVRYHYSKQQNNRNRCACLLFVVVDFFMIHSF